MQHERSDARSPRVLHLISSAGFYGAESMLVNLVECLGAAGSHCIMGVFENLHAPNLEVAEEARRRGECVRIIRCNRRFDWRPVQMIRDIINTEHIELVHSHGYKANLYAYLSTRPLRTPLVATCHLWTNQTLAVRTYGLLDRAVLRRFNRVVGVSEEIARLAREAGIAAEKVTNIANGIDFSPFVNALPRLRDTLQLGMTQVVGTVGRLAEQKGLEYLIRAAKEVLEANSNVTFVLVGEGRDKEKLQQLSRDLGIERHVIFAGRQTDMPGVYGSMDVFALPSIDEGMPMVLLEAMGAGKPVVATAVGDVPKLVVADRTGLVVQPRDVSALRDAILRLLAGKQLRDGLARAGQAWVTEHFSAQAMAAQYLQVYREVLHGEREEAPKRVDMSTVAGNHQ